VTEWKITEATIEAVNKVIEAAVKADYDRLRASGTKLNPLTVPLLHPKKKRKNYSKAHGFHDFMAEVHECQARPVAHVPKRRFTFEEGTHDQ
jgi:hypothetical protein